MKNFVKTGGKFAGAKTNLILCQKYAQFILILKILHLLLYDEMVKFLDKLFRRIIILYQHFIYGHMSIQSLQENEKEVWMIVIVSLVKFEVNINVYLLLILIWKNIIAGIKNNSIEFEYCIVQGCDKTFLKDGKKTLFFK